MTELPQRDRNLLEYLFRHKVARIDQIRRDVFNDVNKRYIYKRIEYLRKLDLVTPRAYYVNNKPKLAYQITQNAIGVIAKDFPYKIDKAVVKSDSIFHDMGLLDVVEAMKNLELVDTVVHENVLRSCSQLEDEEDTREFVWLRSDALIYLRGPNYLANVALEYDRIPKSMARYRNKFEHYYRKKKIHAVLFISKNETLLKKLMKVDHEASQGIKSKIYFARYDDVISMPKELTFTNYKGGKIILN